MALLKCKMCGGELVYEEDMTVCECEYCGSKQTIPSVDDEKIMKLYDRANRLRMANEFDKAAGVYESIIEEKDTEAEAYWGLLLCKYGIEYVDDPATGDKIPTCHRSSFDSIMDDPDFEMVMENADTISRSVYRESAKQIEEIRKGIIEVSGREEPYDIFICYKETDENGERTIDSVLAQDVYDALTEKGYRVFFSRISLEDKVGQEFEPYIFAALNSSKLMLAFGTSYDYYNAVWVKNEWSRFLKLMAKDKEKYLIPCFKNIDAYDIPKEFQHLQAQDMGKVGAIQDLCRGINKLIPKTEPKPEINTVSAVGNSDSITPLLKRAFMFLEDGDFNNADTYLERVLDMDPENAQAYLGKLMVEMRVYRQDMLIECDRSFETNQYYIKTVRFGDEGLVNDLKYYIDTINARNNERDILETYNKAVELMNVAEFEYEFEKAAELFETILQYKDSEALAEQCHEGAKESHNREIEKANEELEKANAKKRRIEAIVSVLKLGKGNSLTDQLAESEQKNSKLCELLKHYDELQERITQLHNEQVVIESRQGDLLAKRAKLGVFSGKEKKKIDEELSELDNKKAEIIQCYEQLEEQKYGYNSKEDVEQSITDIKSIVSDLKLQLEREDMSISYSYDEALDIYMNEPEVTSAVNAVLPKAIFLPCLQGKARTLLFGKCVQGMNSVPSPIEWQIIKTDKERIFLLSKYILDSQPYNTVDSNVTWATCSLRRWLNEGFYSMAFTDEEKSIIQSVSVDADKNPKYSSYPGDKTIDKIFLLSASEATEHFDNYERKTIKTEYAAHSKENSSVNWWWVRTPGYNSNMAVFVEPGGSFAYNGDLVSNERMGVRPALWVDISNF